MSVEELQALIDDISAEIVRQNEVLTQLHHSKCAAQRRLNAIRDPFARLPLEISAYIFVNCMEPFPEPKANNVPMLLLDICSAWTRITLSTPELWTRIRLWGDAHSSLVETWFKRASGRALSIYSHGLGSISDEIIAVISIYAHQVQELETESTGSGIGLDPLLAEGRFPALRTLRMEGLRSTSGAMDILRGLPDLVDCTLDELIGNIPEPGMLVFPCMQHFRVQSYCDDEIFKHLTLPRLTTLFLPLRDSKAQDLLDFLKRSSPSLLELRLGSRRLLDVWTLDEPSEMEECFSLLLMLTNLELLEPNSTTAALVVTILGNSPHLLPNLTSLTFRYFVPDRSWYEKLLGALSVRRAKLASVRVVLEEAAEEDGFEATDDMMGGLRQLAANGLNIHVGTEEHNLL
ncbi:hypothetical protein B0H11DRAFT_1818048 [Mycena galericulata]|nr:hypothetical protein B0H11DRAFT_1818048 [Mycena galericulata]